MSTENDDKPFVSLIKDQILGDTVKRECCRASFICGTEVFRRRNKNAYTEALAAFTEKLKSVKKREFFASPSRTGYVAKEKDGFVFPVSSGMVCENCLKYLLRGAFMAAGRATEKDGSCSVELVVPNTITATTLSDIFSEYGVTAKYTARRGEEILYFRKSETVGDMLLMMGATDAFFRMQYGSRLSGYKSSANRQKNCDATNVRRAVLAAGRQIEAIRAIEKNEGLDSLPKELKETALLRLENPIEPLDGLVRSSGSTVTRSGMNHRLARIVGIAESKGYIAKDARHTEDEKQTKDAKQTKGAKQTKDAKQTKNVNGSNGNGSVGETESPRGGKVAKSAKTRKAAKNVAGSDET